jgi:hypothetical protein
LGFERGGHQARTYSLMTILLMAEDVDSVPPMRVFRWKPAAEAWHRRGVRTAPMLVGRIEPVRERRVDRDPLHDDVKDHGQRCQMLPVNPYDLVHSNTDYQRTMHADPPFFHTLRAQSEP